MANEEPKQVAGWQPIAIVPVPKKINVILIDATTHSTMSVALGPMSRPPRWVTHWCYPPENTEEPSDG